MKIAIETLGCKLNQAETEALQRQFVRAGFEPVQHPAEADVYILNTCTVTHTADGAAAESGYFHHRYRLLRAARGGGNYRDCRRRLCRR